jgi:hypothetical protein
MFMPGVRLSSLAAMMLAISAPAGAAPCVCGGGGVSTWLPRQGLLRFYEGNEPRYPYAWWGGAWRHHGPGEGGYCDDRGVRSLHGLGDGCYGRPVHVRPYFFVNVDEPYPAGEPQPGAAPEDPGGMPEEAAPGDAAPPQPEPTWSFVNRRVAQAALREFAIEALRHPDEAEAKAGFAIAAAILGQDEKACWALRRAAATGLDSLHALVATGGGADGQIRLLITRYGARRGADARFVTAMLHWLLGEDTLAQQNAAMAIAAGDGDPALAAICQGTRQAESGPPLPEDGRPESREAGPSEPRPTSLTALEKPINYRSVANASQ